LSLVLIAALPLALVGCGGGGGSQSAGGGSRTESSPGTSQPKTALAVLKSLKRAGLPIDGYENYTAETDDNHLLGRPGQYVSKANFHDKRLEKWPDFDSNGGGTIETFASSEDAQNRYDYVHAITTSSSLFAEYEYLNGLVLLRLSHDLTPKQAQAYKKSAFDAMLSTGE
jgi:hypothetical protein